jgi:transposase InsO family protein
VFHNPVKDMVLTGPNQAWASGITYVRTDDGFLYLCLITDMRSRKIVGYHAGDTLETEGAVKAPGMAPAQLPEGAHPVAVRTGVVSIVRICMSGSSGRGGWR